MGIEGLDALKPDNGDLMSEETTPAKAPDRTDLPLEGDPDEFSEEPLPEEAFANADNDETMDNFEAQEEPNDLSEVDKEFED
jgi:hypothetical protein